MTASSLLPFSGKVALIAGASRGIGAVTARAFADAGAAVVLAARDRQALDSLAESIRVAGGRSLAVAGDVVDEVGQRGAVIRVGANVIEQPGRHFAGSIK